MTTKYLFLYWGSARMERWEPSPEEMQQVFAQWTEWKSKFKANVKDTGDGLKPGGKLVKDNGQVMDGPLPEMKEVVTGYSIVEAESFEEAAKVARACPIFLMPGATVEIRQMMGY
jgi:hypothetical protein